MKPMNDWTPGPLCANRVFTLLAAVLTISGCADSSAPIDGSRTASTKSASDADWTSTVQRRIADAEYQVRPGSTGGDLVASNRSQGFRVRWTVRGAVSVQAREAGGELLASTRPGWRVALRTSGWGREDRLREHDAPPAIGGCAPGSRLDVRGDCIREVERRSDEFVEWWRNDRDGLEQGWTVLRRPGGAGTLLVDLEVEGLDLEVTESGRAASLTGSGVPSPSVLPVPSRSVVTAIPKSIPPGVGKPIPLLAVARAAGRTRLPWGRSCVRDPR